MDSSRKATVSKKDTVQVKAKDAPRHQAKGKKPFTSLSAAASARVKSGKGGVFKYTHEELLKVQEVVAASPLPPPPAGIPAEVRRRQNRDFSAAMWHPIAETKRIHAKTEEVKESLRGEGKPKLMPSPTPKETAKAERLLSREAENEDKQVFDEIFRDVVMNEEKKKTASPKPPPPPLEALDDEDEDDELLDDETSHPAQEASASAMATPVKSGARDLTKPPELLPATAEMLTPSRVVAQSPAHCTPHTRQSLSPQMSPAGSVREMQNVSPAAATPSPSPVPVSMLSAKHPARSQSSSVGYNSSMTPPSSAVRSSVSPLPMSAHAASVSPKPTPGSTIAARQMMYQGHQSSYAAAAMLPPSMAPPQMGPIHDRHAAMLQMKQLKVQLVQLLQGQAELRRCMLAQQQNHQMAYAHHPGMGMPAGYGRVPPHMM